MIDEALFFVMGIGSLFPWNAFITESGYFTTRFAGSSYQATFESGFGVAYNVSNMLTLVTMLWLQKYMTEWMVIAVPFIGTGIIFCGTAMMTQIDVTQQNLFAITTATVLICGVMSGPMISGSAALASRFSKSCVAIFYTGQAFGGGLASLSSLFTTLVAGNDNFCNSTVWGATETPAFVVDWSAFWYFSVAAMVCFISVFAYGIVKVRQSKMGNPENSATVEAIDELDEEDGSLLALGEREDVEDAGANTRSVDTSGVDSMSGSVSLGESLIGQYYDSMLPKEASWDRTTVETIFSIIRYPCIAVFCTFFSTLSVFPAIVAQTESVHKCEPGASRFSNELFVPILFLIFNASDFAGRALMDKWQPFNGKQLMTLALARFLFWPLFYVQNIRGSRLPILFNADFWPLAIATLCGFTNGFVSTSSMVTAQISVPKVHRDVASVIASLFLTLGLTFGAFGSYLSIWIVQG